MKMNNRKEMKLTEMEKINGAGFDPFTGKAVPDMFPPEKQKAVDMLKKFLEDLKHRFGF